MDVGLGSEVNGMGAARQIKEDSPDTGIVLLSSHTEKEYLNSIAKLVHTASHR